jgi:cell division septal protein FtsQ
MSKKHKKKIRLSGLIFILLLAYFIGVSIYYIIKLPVKNIKVEGLNILTEGDIIQAINLDDSFPMIKLTSGYLKDKFKNMPLIDDFKLKKNLKGQVTITIEEAKILFFYNYDNHLVLSNEKTIDDDNRYLGYPILVNYVPSDVYKGFIKNFSKIDSNVIAMISEIEYDPDRYEDVIVDNERFVFIMNDGNKVYINVANIDKMNKYQNVVAKTNQTGTLYLDSSGKNFIFKLAGTNED